MAYFPSTAEGVLSTSNNTTSNLTSGAAFTGTAEEVILHSCVTVYVFTSHASATDGLSMQQSSDGTNWDVVDSYTVPAMTAGQGRTYGIQVTARYFRVVYTNGGTGQTTFRLQTIFHKIEQRSSSVRPQDARTNEIDTSEMTSYLMGYNGSTWDRLRSDTTNGLDVDVTRVSGVVAVSDNASSLTVDAPVATPVFVRLSDGSAAISTLPVSLSSVPSHAVTNVGTFAVQESGSALTALQLIDDTVFVDDAAFAVGTSKVNATGFMADETSTDSVDEGDIGIARMTLDRKQIVSINPHTAGGLSTYHLVSAATTNATVVKNTPGQVFGWYIYNSNAAARKVVFHNASSTPTAGASVFFSLVIPPTSGANVEMTNGIAFSTGISITTVTGLADNDTAAVAANDLVINIFYK